MKVETSSSRHAGLRDALNERDLTGRLRKLRHFRPEPESPFLVAGDLRLLNFSSNDYLGLATDPEVAEAAASAARRYGAGAGASRLVVGGFDLHEELETELADFASRPSALLFNSGFQANASILPALAARGSHVFCDRHSHASILHGCRMDRIRFRRFRHNDAEHLGHLLDEHGSERGGPALVVTESVFSMGGDRAPLEDLCEVADRHDAVLMVDDAHAVGVFGSDGSGLAAAHDRVDIVLGTFGKAFGASGAFVACDETLRSYLVNFCAGFIYTTAPPPPTIGAVRSALRKIRSGLLGQDRFLELVDWTHLRLRAAGFETAPSDTQIVPIHFGDEREAVECGLHLERRGILAVPIRPPTVPEGGARIRVSLTRLHTMEHVRQLVGALQEFRDRS